MITRVTAAGLHARLRAPLELALLDPRETGTFHDGHLFWAVNVPLSHLELRVSSLVPRAATPMVWCDAGEGLAERAASRAAELGYTDVAVLDGGLDAWRRAGLPVYSGVNVPSKAFGEFVEHRDGTPRVTAADLRAMWDRGERPFVLDARTFAEYQRMSIPTGVSCPGGELVWRVRAACPDPARPIVVNCAGRTRSIIGAQSLRAAGIPNPVMALENGTMGFELAGLALDHGRSDAAPWPDADAQAWAVAATAAIAHRGGLAAVDAATVAAWLRDASRTTVVLDVRDPAEAEADADGSLAVRRAPGGQLVQATDEYVGVRRSRLVIADEGSGARATMAAAWLLQMGAWDVYVLRDGEAPGAGAAALADLPTLPAGAIAVPEPPAPRRCRAGEAAVVIDVGPSERFRRGHRPGAFWCVRSRLAEAPAVTRPVTGVLAFTAPDDALASWAAADAVAAGWWPDATIAVLADDAAARTELGIARAATAVDDAWIRPYDRHERSEVEAWMRRYLEWEVGLLDQIGRDDTVAFAPATFTT